MLPTCFLHSPHRSPTCSVRKSFSTDASQKWYCVVHMVLHVGVVMSVLECQCCTCTNICLLVRVLGYRGLTNACMHSCNIQFVCHWLNNLQSIWSNWPHALVRVQGAMLMLFLPLLVEKLPQNWKGRLITELCTLCLCVCACVHMCVCVCTGVCVKSICFNHP